MELNCLFCHMFYASPACRLYCNSEFCLLVIEKITVERCEECRDFISKSKYYDIVVNIDLTF